MKKIMNFEAAYVAPEVTVIDIQSEGVLAEQLIRPTGLPDSASVIGKMTVLWISKI